MLRTQNKDKEETTGNNPEEDKRPNQTDMYTGDKMKRKIKKHKDGKVSPGWTKQTLCGIVIVCIHFGRPWKAGLEKS